MLTFLKIFARCMEQKFKIIYVEESALQTINNHLKIRLEDKEDFYAKIGEKKNLI